MSLSQILRAILYVIVITSFPVYANAEGEELQPSLHLPEPQEIPREEIFGRSEPYGRCKKVAQESRDDCVNFSSEMFAATSVEVSAVSQASGTNIKENVDNLQVANASGMEKQAAIFKRCEADYLTCFQTCDRARKYHDQASKVAASYAVGDDPALVELAKEAKGKHEINRDNSSKGVEYCKTIENRMTMAFLEFESLGGNARDLAKPSKSLQSETAEPGFWERNQDWMIGGGVGLAAGGLAGYLIGSSGKDKKDKNPAPAKENTTPTTNNNEGCMNPSDTTQSECVSHYISACSLQNDSSACKAFEDAYCGKDAPETTTAASAQTTAKGKGTPFCVLTAARTYCATYSSPQAPACIWIASRGEACKSNPASSECFPQYESNEAFRQACQAYPSDPLCNSSMASLIGTVNPTQQQATNTHQPPAGTGAFRNFASTGAHDVDVKFGPSLFQRSSNEIRQMCHTGQMLDCGPRKLNR